MTRSNNTGSIVKTGGIAKNETETEDGGDVQESAASVQSENGRDAEFRRAEISGDRIASRGDAAKIHGDGS